MTRTIALAAVAAIVFSVPGFAQVSTDGTNLYTVYKCTAKNARNKYFTAASTKLAKAKSQAISACKRDVFPKGCTLTGCIG